MPSTKSFDRSRALRSASRPSTGSAYSVSMHVPNMKRAPSTSSITPSSNSSGVRTPSKRLKRSHGPVYKINPHELEEDYEIAKLIGESESSQDDIESKPVRVLDNFSLYCYRTRAMCYIPATLDEDDEEDGKGKAKKSHLRSFGGSGIARATMQGSETDSESEDEDESPEVEVKLAGIVKSWAGPSPQDPDVFEFWIMTDFAWYKLGQPSLSFAPYFEEMMADALREWKRSSPVLKKDKELLPVVTPTVSKLAIGLFLRSELIMGHSIDEADRNLANLCVQAPPNALFATHQGNPESMIWGESIGTDLYESVTLDGVTYFANDVVAVLPPRDDEDAASNGDDNASESGENLSGHWFCEIRYFYDKIEGSGPRKKRTKMFHGRWLEHGSRTILAETSHPRAIFLMDTCDDNEVASIVQKIEVEQLDADEKEPFEASESALQSAKFFLRYKWCPETLTLREADFDEEDAKKREWEPLIGRQPDSKTCYSCALNDVTYFRKSCDKRTPGVLKIFGIDYHKGDFVYAKGKEATLVLAQIEDLMSSSHDDELQIRILERHQLKEVSADRSNFRSLRYTDEIKTVDAISLDGKFRVRTKRSFPSSNTSRGDGPGMREWLADYNNFIFHGHSNTLQQCQLCSEIDEKTFRTMHSAKSNKLKAMDLFAGAGGLTTGMDASGFIETRWAVEMSPSPCSTLKANYPEITVYNQDVNELLRHASERSTTPLYAIGDRYEKLPPLPQPGEVDIIMGGPPCQPYSDANQYKKVDDIRQTCIPTMLSYVEYFSPKYVLIENVTGLLHYRLNGEQQGLKIIGGIKGGMVKFIMRVLSALGYQCQIRVLNSAEYGAPQQRRRVIFWGARLGLPLPKWPIPTHIPRGRIFSTKRLIHGVGLVPIAMRNELDEGESNRRAPFYSVNVDEAIGDLVPFDWEDPGVLSTKIPPREDVDTFIAHTSPDRDIAGFDYLKAHASLPKSDYQARLRWQGREDAGQCAMRVGNHVTPLFSSNTVERTVHVPMRPLAGLLDLPRHLRLDPQSKGTIRDRGQFKRIDGNGSFMTITTDFNPGSRGSTILHPHDRRTISVREAARAQGFPDIYEFCSVEDAKGGTRKKVLDHYKQIGNAVPCHLALALGRALGEGRAETIVSGTHIPLERALSEEL